MKKSKIFKLSGAFLLPTVLLVASLLFYFKFNPKEAVNLILPEINRVNFVKAVIKNDTAYVEIHTVIQNKSFYELDIDSLYYELRLEGLALPAQKVNLHLRQRRFQVDTIALPVKLPIKKIRHTIKASQDQDSIALDGDFHVLYNTFIGRHALSFNKKIKFGTPVPPEIKVLKVEHKKIKLFDGTVMANVLVLVKNKGRNLDLKTNNIKYKFKIDKLMESAGIYEQTVIIKPKSETMISIPVAVKIGKVLKASWLVLRDKDDVNYTITIEADLENGKLPEKLPVSVTASGKAEIIK
jgi:LEA14-like dessication related protein